MSIFGKCKRCGWERPGGNYYHTSEACNDMREDRLIQAVRGAHAALTTLEAKAGRVSKLVYIANRTLHEALKEWTCCD